MLPQYCLAAHCGSDERRRRTWLPCAAGSFSSSPRALASVAKLLAQRNLASTSGVLGCGSFRVTRSEWSYDARDGVVEVSGCVDVVSFLSEVVVPVGLEVAVGFDGA